MRRTSLVLFALASGALLCASAQAESQQKNRPSRVQAAAQAAELTVQKRSFLDPGNVVPVDSMNRYVNQGTIYAKSPGGTFRNDNFGDWLLPGAFGLPGFVPR